MSFRPFTLYIQQGKTLTKSFRRRYNSGPYAGQAVDFPAIGATAAILQVRPKSASEGGEVLVELKTTDGGISLTRYTDGRGKQWSGQLYMSAAATKILQPWGDATYELVVYDPAGTWTKTIFHGTCVLVPATTVVPI